MNKGWFLQVAVSNKGFYISLFKLFHFGITTISEPAFSTMLTLGLWHYEIGLMFAKKHTPLIDTKNHGIS